MVSFYERFWTARLDVLERLLRNDQRRSPAGEKEETIHDRLRNPGRLWRADRAATVEIQRRLPGPIERVWA